MNGGFGQYLTNTDGVFVEETIGLLAEIGAPRTCELLARAARLCDGADSYAAAWASRTDDLGELDERFLSAAEDLAGLTFDRLLAPGMSGGRG